MLHITSTAFRNEDEIPTRRTCEGEDISPALEWGSVPEGTQSLVLVVDDPDAPKMVWVHWVLYNRRESLSLSSAVPERPGGRSSHAGRQQRSPNSASSGSL